MGKWLLKTARLWTKLLARALLILLLLVQLGVLWVVTHQTPTRLPPAALRAVSEIFSRQLSFDCREATIDNCGRIRLGGAQLSSDVHPGDWLYADLDFTLDWHSLLKGKLEPLSLQVRGRGTLGEPGNITACDDFVIRLEEEENVLLIQSAARIGAMVLRADLTVPSHYLRKQPRASAKATAEAGWNRTLAHYCLRALRAHEGSATLSLNGHEKTIQFSGDFIENPASLSALPVTAKRGNFRGTFDKKWNVQLHLEGLSSWDVHAHEAWIFLNPENVLHAYLSDIHVEGLGSIDAFITHRWQDGLGTLFGLHLSTQTSWLQTTLIREDKSFSAKDTYAHLAASDLSRLTSVARVAREIGADLSGSIDLCDAEIIWDKNAALQGQGSFAFSRLGWRDIRPAWVRPEMPWASFTGDFKFSTEKNHLQFTQLNLAGLCGEISGGLRAGDAYSIRLHSTEGHPVNPASLNGLLGAWWKDLWQRFDLSTTETRPRADVLVKGKWGAEDAEKVLVRAQLDNFGFMGGRFLSTDLWVTHTPQATTVRIDSLRGELEGKDAGEARALIEWNSQKPEWGGQPRISGEGNIQPGCILRLYDVSLANQLRSWKFQNHHLQLTLEADRSVEVQLRAPESSTLGGIQVEGLELGVSKKSASPEIILHATGEVSGGRITVDLKGDLARQNTLAVTAVDWSRTGFIRFIERIQGRESGKKGSKDKSTLAISYKGTLDFEAPWATEGEGYALLTDSNLKTVHLLGGLSEGLDALGVSFSSYPLDRAELALRCKGGLGVVKRLDLTGTQASLKFKGSISLRDGSLDLAGQMKVNPSPWGPLGLLNPNRLIASMINVYLGGTLRKPEVSLKKPSK